MLLSKRKSDPCVANGDFSIILMRPKFTTYTLKLRNFPQSESHKEKKPYNNVFVTFLQDCNTHIIYYNCSTTCN